MNVTATTEGTVAAVEEYERECVHLIDSVNTSLKWTVAWLVVTLAFNCFLFYVNAAACDKIRKVRDEMKGLRLDLAKRQQFITKSMKSMLQMTAGMENVQLSQRIDRVLDKYVDSFNSSTSSVPTPMTPSASASVCAPALAESRPLTPEPLLNDDTVELFPMSEEEDSASHRPLVDVEAQFNKLEEKVCLHLNQSSGQCDEKEKMQLEQHMMQLRELKNSLKSVFRKKPP